MLCATIQTCTTYTTIICLFVILITQLFVRSSQWRFSNHDCFVHKQLRTRLTDFLLVTVANSALSCLFIVQHNQYNERSCSRLLENSIAILFLFVFNVSSCCVRLCCAFVFYLFHTDVVYWGIFFSNLYILRYNNLIFLCPL